MSNLGFLRLTLLHRNGCKSTSDSIQLKLVAFNEENGLFFKLHFYSLEKYFLVIKPRLNKQRLIIVPWQTRSIYSLRLTDEKKLRTKHNFSNYSFQLRMWAIISSPLFVLRLFTGFPCYLRGLSSWEITECVTDSDQKSKIIMFESILTNFQRASFLRQLRQQKLAGA